jgi:hypothetical protein
VADGNPKLSDMRALIGCLVVVVASAATAPSPQELRKTYGSPDLEHFMARPTIGLSVEYGSDHEACRVLIEPPRQLFHPDESLPLMSSDTVTEILEEIAPVKMRGMSITSSIDFAGCVETRRTQYQRLEINRVSNGCPSPKSEHEVRATIEYRRDICRKAR